MRKLQSIVSKIDRLLTPRRVYHYPLIALLFMVGTTVAARATATGPYASQGMMGDFIAKVTGGRILLNGEMHRLYEVKHQFAIQQQLLGSGNENYLNMFVAPPFVAFFFAPFAALPYSVAYNLWQVVNLGLIVAALYLLWPLVPRLHRYGFGKVLVVAVSCRATFLLLVTGQDSAITLLLFAAGLRLLLAGRDTFAGTVLGLGVFKPQFFVLMPIILLLQRRWHALGAWIATASILTGLSIGLVGMAGVQAYVELLTSSNYQELELTNTPKMISLVALARTMLLPEPIPLLVVAGAAVTLLALFHRFAMIPTRDARQFALLYAAAVLITAITNPHILVYDCVILLLPALVLLNHAPRLPALRVSLAIAYVLLFLSPLSVGVFGFAPLTVLPVVGLLFVARRLLASNEGKAIRLPEHRTIPGAPLLTPDRAP